MKDLREIKIIRSIKKNLIFEITYLSKYVPMIKVIRNDAIISCVEVDDDTFNVVIDAHFKKSNLDQKIYEIVKIFKEKKLPFSWWISPYDTPYNLKDELISKGFKLQENLYGMYLILKNYRPKTLKRLDIINVQTVDELKKFCSISFDNPKVFETIYSKIPSKALEKETVYRIFLGFKNKKAVTTGILAFHANVAGIYFIVTLPEERKKGYATEMMYYLLNQAKMAKYNIAILQSTEAGLKLYNEMGFVECCVFQEYKIASKT